MTKRLLSQTKAWPHRSLNFNQYTKDTVLLTANPPVHYQVMHYADDASVIHHDEGGKKQSIDFNRSRIRSIELQSKGDYLGVNEKAHKYQLKNRTPGSTKRFLSDYGLNENFLDKDQNNWPVVIGVMAFVAWAYGVYAITRFELFFIEAFDHSVVRVEHPIIWPIAYVLAIVPAIFAGFLTRKLQPEPRAYFWYDKSQEWLVVYYMVDGERFILASTYGNKSAALRMHTDHVNAWQAAKLEEKSKPAAAKDDADEYL